MRKPDNMNQLPILAIVAPCYNEELILQNSLSKLSDFRDHLIGLKLISDSSYILVVDDGSKDDSYAILKHNIISGLRVVKLSRNYGHQRALLAGMHYVKDRCDMMISIDIDLQDDLDVIKEMIAAYKERFEVVFGVRNNRDSDSFFKKYTALLFYRLMSSMGVETIQNHADFRLLSNRVLCEFAKYREQNLFLRGIFPRLGYRTTKIYYKRLEREAGETKYPFLKMLGLAIDGITSFSNKPLRLISAAGFLTFIFSLILSVWVLVVYLTGKSIPGWASITLPVYLIAGVQLLCLGIIGEYVSKIYIETKHRPPYHVEELLGWDDKTIAEANID